MDAVSSRLRLSALLCVLGLLLAGLPSTAPGAQKKPRKDATLSSDPKPAQAEVPPEEGPQLFPFRAGVTEVMAPVTVVAKNGENVLNLSPNDFTLYDNGVPQKITVLQAEMPISLVILIGNSDRIEPFLPQVRKTGILFTDLLLGDQGQAAVITFDHRVEMAQDFTHNADQLQKVFRDVKVGSGQSRLADAMIRGLSLLAKQPEGRRKVIVVIAEDRNAGSEMSLDYALREAQLGGVSIYSVGLSFKSAMLRSQTPVPPANSGPYPPGVQAGPTPPLGGIAAEQTAGVTGGDYGRLVAMVASGIKDIFVKSPLEGYAKGTGALHTSSFSMKAIETNIQQISAELHSQYLITYRPSTLNQLGFHTIQVKVDRDVAEVRVRPGYVYPGPAVETLPPPPSPPPAQK